MPHIAVTLFVAQLLVMLVSWLLSAVFPDSGIRSLLSAEGLRWFFGHFSYLLATPLLVCLLLLSMAYGVFCRCGLLSYQHSYRERRALTMTLLLAAVAVILLLLMAAVPHAVMLSATGSLGLMAGHLANRSDVYDALLDGIRRGAPLLLFYLLIVQLYLSLRYTLPW